MDPHCFGADPEPYSNPTQNLDLDPDPDPDLGGGGGRSAKKVHPPWQNPRYAPDCGLCRLVAMQHEMWEEWVET